MAGPRRIALAVACAVLLSLASGCEFTGVGSLPLPFRAGAGSDATTVTVQMRSAANLVPNSEVKVADVTVGTVTGIRFDNWRADLTVALQPDTELPADAVAKVAQKSLLGATYLEMAPPPTSRGTGRLRDGDVIPVERTGDYPSTEQVLASLSVVLNGGGLNHLRTISTELNKAFAGREPDFRALIDNLNSLVGTLDQQKGEIVRAIDGLNRLSARLASQQPTIEQALNDIPAGLAVLNRNREQLTSTLTDVGELGTVANRVINGSRDDLLANLRQLRPTLGELASSDRNLTESLGVAATFPFPSATLGKAFKGDYANLFVTLDVTLAQVQKGYLARTPLGALPALNPGQQMTDPLRAPLVGSLPGLDPAMPPRQPAEDPTDGGSAPAPPTSSAPVPPPDAGNGAGETDDSGGLLGPLTGGR